MRNLHKETCIKKQLIGIADRRLHNSFIKIIAHYLQINFVMACVTVMHVSIQQIDNLE